ncbi:MAG TPA: choice-of-anchor Q domain-containing protein [Chitinophagales bacterium]|nr:choice-of-anchor Q domain-containing protein [Chitinophagales bacterium]
MLRLSLQRLIVVCVVMAFSALAGYGATYTVTKTADTNDGNCSTTDCSLREAVAAANGTSADDTVNFNIPTSDTGCSGGVCVITLGSQLTINSASSSGTLAISNAGGGQKIEISGGNAVRVLEVASGGNLTINSLTIRNGSASGGFGGGILNNGTLTVFSSTFTGNFGTDGGGIANFNGATAFVVNSTISGNSSGNSGGIYNGTGATLTLVNSTIVNNTALGIFGGGGMRNLGTVNARNTIIANNSGNPGPDFNGTLTSQGHNMIGNTTDTTITGTTTGNILNQDPKLAPLGDYGGLTKTHALLPDSPALNAGNNSLATDPISGFPLATDQRGAARISYGTVDIGAFEQRYGVVTNTNDSGTGSLRDEATSQFGGLISFNIPTSSCPGGVCVITLSSQITINRAVILTNEGGSQKIEISGGNAVRVFEVSSGGNLTVNSLTIRNGSGNGSGILNNGGTVTVINSTIRNNSNSGVGGGIYNDGTATIINSTISNNSATDGGGGIANNGTATIINSTISNNSTGLTFGGGGILNFVSGTVNARNTIIANNSATNTNTGPDFKGTLTSQGYNLIGNTSGTNITGTTTGNILNQDPKLAPLGDYGGLTKTHALLPDSPALNAGNNCVLTQGGCGSSDPPIAVNVDQRGNLRTTNAGGNVDIGAYEQRYGVVTNTNDSGAGSLRDEATSQFGGLISFNIPASSCSGGVCVITLSSQITINRVVILTNEGGSQKIEISGNDAVRVFEVSNGANLTVNSLTIRNGKPSSGTGGGILNSGGTITVTNSTIRNNSTSGFLGDGGGIDNSGTATITNSTISNNSAGVFSGGGIRNNGTATIINSTISNNSAGDGGGIFNDSGTATIVNSTISNNSVVGSGSGGGIYYNSGTATIINSTISNNSATGGLGGGVFNFGGTVNARNTIIANNSAGLGPDFNGNLTSQGNNLIRNTSGISSTLDPSDITGEDPLLAPLGYYGGKTWTRAFMTTPTISSALNGGNNCVRTLSCSSNNPPSAITTDQRGASRTSGVGNVDIGAYELNGFYLAALPNGTQSSAYSFQITSNNESCTMSMTGLPSGLSLQQSGTAYNIAGTPTQTGNFTPQLTITCGTNQATVNYSMAITTPTAGGVTISGRVYATGGGRGLHGATVVLTDMNGNERTTLSSTFGYFRFDDVRAGEAYILSVRSRRYQYLPQYFFVGENISDIGFYPVASNPCAASPPATNPATVAPTQAPEQQPPGRPGQNLLQKPGRIETKSEMKTLTGGYKQWN